MSVYYLPVKEAGYAMRDLFALIVTCAGHRVSFVIKSNDSSTTRCPGLGCGLFTGS